MLKNTKKLICMIMVIVIVFSSATSAFAIKPIEQIEIETKIQEIENYRKVAIENVIKQLEVQDRLDQLHIYESEIDRLAKIEIDLITNRSTMAYRYSVPASRGGVEISTSSYATTTRTYFPNGEINSLIEGYATGFKNFVVGKILDMATTGTGWAIVGLIFDGINSFHVSMLRGFRDSGKGVQKMAYVDHTEGNRGSYAYFEWYPTTHINSTGGTVFTYYSELI